MYIFPLRVEGHRSRFDLKYDRRNSGGLYGLFDCRNSIFILTELIQYLREIVHYFIDVQ